MQTIRDSMGKVLATITADANGVMTMRSFLGAVLGAYDPKTNQTRDAMGRVVGTGNLLAMLIER